MHSAAPLGGVRVGPSKWVFVILGGRGSRRAENRLSAPARQEPRPPTIVQLWLARPVTPRITQGYLAKRPMADKNIPAGACTVFERQTCSWETWQDTAVVCEVAYFLHLPRSVGGSAGLRASQQHHQGLSQTELEVRGRVHRTGAMALKAAINERREEGAAAAVALPALGAMASRRGGVENGSGCVFREAPSGPLRETTSGFPFPGLYLVEP